MNRELLLEGVGRRYGLGGAPWVLRGVDLTPTPGTLTRIEGANGNGKSTLLRLLAGIHLGSVHGLSRGEAARAAVEWLERLGAAEYARTPMSELSKGSSQKAAVAQALLAEPELLVLDEACTGLDTAARTVMGSSAPREEAYVVVEVQGPPGAEPPAEATRSAVSVEEPGSGRCSASPSPRRVRTPCSGLC